MITPMQFKLIDAWGSFNDDLPDVKLVNTSLSVKDGRLVVAGTLPDHIRSSLAAWAVSAELELPDGLGKRRVYAGRYVEPFALSDGESLSVEFPIGIETTSE